MPTGPTAARFIAELILSFGCDTYMIGSIGLLLPQVATGKIRALAFTGAKRIDAAPGVPTLVEVGFPGNVYMPWMGIAVPAGTPKELSID